MLRNDIKARVKAQVVGDGRWGWPLGMVVGDGRWGWPLGMGRWGWSLGMAVGDGRWEWAPVCPWLPRRSAQMAAG